MTEPALMNSVTPEALRELLLEAGYRVELVDATDGSAALRSATGGLGFEIRFANPSPGQDGAFADVTFLAVFQVHGELPLELVNRWNLTRRFARLQLAEAALLFSYDVNLLGGIAPAHLRAQAEIWDRLVQQLITYLRDELPKLAKPAPVAEPASETEAAETVSAA